MPVVAHIARRAGTSEAEADEEAEREVFIAHTHAVLGLKVADGEEAVTVRRVGNAVFGLVVLLVLHVLVHLAQGGRALHASVHLVTSAALPLIGYWAVSQRSTRAAWGFHFMSAFSVVLHIAMFVAMVQHSMQLKQESAGASCSQYAHVCEGEAAEVPAGSFTQDQASWRCLAGFCIAGGGRCDGVFNCFDRSDESDCGFSRMVREPNPDKYVCQEVADALAAAPQLKVWWGMVSLPMWLLSAYAAYHSLEFYVQLRLRGLSARVDRVTAQATVFDQGEVEHAE